MYIIAAINSGNSIFTTIKSRSFQIVIPLHESGFKGGFIQISININGYSINYGVFSNEVRIFPHSKVIL